MKELVKAGCELLAENRDVIRRNFKWDYDMMSVAASVVHTGAGKEADIDRLMECRKLLKKREGVFSTFRGSMELLVISKMAISEDPEGYLTELISVYDMLCKGKVFGGSEYIAMTALAICDEHRRVGMENIVEKTKQLMKKMGSKHPFLTSEEDMAFAALLAMTDKNVDQILEEMEYCFEVMKKRFPFHANSVQALSQVMALCEGSPESKCEKVCAIYDAFLGRGMKYGLEYELASLGALVNIPLSPAEIAEDILEASEFLKHRKGFGDWSMGKKTRTMFAALIEAQAFAPSSEAMDSTVLGSSLAIVIAEEIAVMITIVMISSSSSSSN